MGDGIASPSMLLGGLPDPINIIPFGIGLASKARLPVKLALGAGEEVVATSIQDALVYPELNRQGENFTYKDVLADMAMGAVLGSGLSGLGHWVGNASFAREAHADIAPS